MKEYYSFYIGGMGARGKNFYNDLFARYGYEAEAKEIQELFLGGQQREAAGKVPDAFVDEVALVGPVERIRDRLAAWRESGATTLLVSTRDEATLRARRRSRVVARHLSRYALPIVSSAVCASSGTATSKIAARVSSAPSSPRM